MTEPKPSERDREAVIEYYGLDAEQRLLFVNSIDRLAEFRAKARAEERAAILEEICNRFLVRAQFTTENASSVEGLYSWIEARGESDDSDQGR